ncbi:MAG: hypothetical protein KDA20_07915 [Phycisphaerales bacterium]|nr:hypothetical protein [Phycisphaerales bacterium]
MSGRLSVLSGLGLMICAVTARTAPIIHDNSDGTFVWDSFSRGGAGFEVNLSPSENNASNQGRIWYIGEWTPSIGTDREWEAISAPFWDVIVETRDFGVAGEPPRTNALKSLNIGAVVGPAQTFTHTGAAYTRLYSPTQGELASVGNQVIMGLAFQLNGETHYGFVALQKGSESAQEATYQPVLWGWESTPNTPMTVALPVQCPTDLNGDGVVSVDDLQIMLFWFGQTAPPGLPADLNQDGLVNLKDLTALLFAMGYVCP